MLKRISFLFIVLLLAFYSSVTPAANVPISLFPLTHYTQDIDAWLSPQDSNYKNPLLSTSYQKKRFNEFYLHVFSTDKNAFSPWSKNFVSTLLNKNPGVLAMQKSRLLDFSNENKDPKQIGYGENFHPYTEKWIGTIAHNIDLSALEPPIKYRSNNRGIIVKNTYARMLPTNDSHFYHFELPGQGYPFDNLQASALWVGTPVYIVSKTKDGAWSLVITSSFIAWIESNAVAKANLSFVQLWSKIAKSQLIAITNTKTPVADSFTKTYQFDAYIGTVLPLLAEKSSYFKIAVPIKTFDGKARIKKALVDKQFATKMPLLATPENFSKLIKTLVNRPYGWGNLYFYNDCSAELQNLYTPFGIWLPRNSSKQSMVGKVTDLTAEPAEKRLDYLMKNGHPLLTTVYIGSHIFMYIGNYPNPNSKDHESMAMTYQNIWGLSPKDKSRRVVIGQAVLLPLLLSYPEDLELNSLANKQFFRVSDLDQWPDTKNNSTNLFFSSPSS